PLCAFPFPYTTLFRSVVGAAIGILVPDIGYAFLSMGFSEGVGVPGNVQLTTEGTLGFVAGGEFTLANHLTSTAVQETGSGLGSRSEEHTSELQSPDQL